MIIKHLQPITEIKIVFAIILTLFSIYLYFEGTYFGITLLGVAFEAFPRF